MFWTPDFYAAFQPQFTVAPTSWVLSVVTWATTTKISNTPTFQFLHSQLQRLPLTLSNPLFWAHLEQCYCEKPPQLCNLISSVTPSAHALSFWFPASWPWECLLGLSTHVVILSTNVHWASAVSRAPWKTQDVVVNRRNTLNDLAICRGRAVGGE